MHYLRLNYRYYWLQFVILAFGLIFLTSCGGFSAANTGSTSSTASTSMQAPASVSSGQNQTNSKLGQSQTKDNLADANQYLIKTLKLSMQVKDTRKAANALQSWISSVDTRSLSTGTDYEPVGNNLYTIALTFSVQSSLYPRIYTYLRDYSSQNGAHLSSFTETVQDVTGDYVDTQSRLKSLHTEQARLLDLMSHAQTLGDIVTLEQRLTDVEGQIETYEGRVKHLDSQISFYTIQISLEPVDTASPPSEPGWSLGQVFQQAFSASLAFARVLLTFLVWLLAFVWYAIPVLIIVWLVRRFKFRLPTIIPAAAKTNAKP
ncbi:MAG: DUF4349 domain-containing protein [Ktedonobacteraceae bacterium]